MKVRIWQASLLAVIVFGVALTWAAPNNVQLIFKDGGTFITGVNVAAMDTVGGRTLQRADPSNEGIYEFALEPGQKVGFAINDPQEPIYLETIIPENVADVVVIQIPVPQEPAQAAPANDLCEDAIAVAVPSLTAGTTNDATFDDVGTCTTTNTAPGVWYSVIGTGATMTASLCELSGGSATYDTKISIFDGSCDGLNCVIGNDDESGCSFHSSASWCSQAGVEYLILVHGYSSSVGDFELGVYDDGSGCNSGACCNCSAPPFNCAVVTAGECAAAGGQYAGDNMVCEGLAGDPVGFYSSPNLPIDASNPVVTDTIGFAGAFYIGDVNIQLEIDHAYIGDLSIDITHDGNTQNIWDGRCGSTVNLHATADDQGTETSCLAVAAGPPNAVFYPPSVAALGLLANFNGMQVWGPWTLTVTDTFPSLDDGVLVSWGVVADAIGESACPDQNNDKCFLCPTDPGGGGCDEADDEDGTDPATEFTLSDEASALPSSDYRRGLGRR